MKSYKMLSSMAFAVGACAALAGCSAEAADDGREPEADVQDVVGITDLGLIEKTFGLKLDKKVNGAWSRDVTKGSCYAAYVTGDKPAEYRRYANGAAFFAPNAQYTKDQGHQRPVLCVDLDEAGFSLDGLGLDIAFRFGLGKAIGTDSAMGGEGGFMFERGWIHTRYTGSMSGPSAADVAAVRGAPTAKLIERPMFLGGYVLDVTVTGASVYEPMGGGTTTRDLQLSGSLAATAYAAAYAQSGAAFALSRDPLGVLSGMREDGKIDQLRAEHGGDGPGWWMGLFFKTATVSEAGYWDEQADGKGREVRTFRVTGPSNPGDAYVEKASVECEQSTVYASLDDQVGTPMPMKCTGL